MRTANSNGEIEDLQQVGRRLLELAGPQLRDWLTRAMTQGAIAGDNQ